MFTNLTGITICHTGSRKLIHIYKKILIISDRIPKTAAYKKNVETIIRHRLCIVQNSKFDRKEIEDQICCGTLESLILQAEAEFNLIQKMILWKPWEDLVEKPLPNQWTWPPN